MREEPHYQRREREAAERLATIMALPMPENTYDIGVVGTFDPWLIFPSLYGSYCSSFDECAVAVLIELRDGTKVRDDLGAEMLREMLCNADLCDYGTSPRSCFPTPAFEAVLPELIQRWRAFSELQWSPQ